jgi:hypothetical protein
MPGRCKIQSSLIPTRSDAPHPRHYADVLNQGVTETPKIAALFDAVLVDLSGRLLGWTAELTCNVLLLVRLPWRACDIDAIATLDDDRGRRLPSAVSQDERHDRVHRC